MKADTMALKDGWKRRGRGTSGRRAVPLWTYELYLSNVTHCHLKMPKAWNRINCHHIQAHFIQCNMNMQHTVLWGFLYVCTETIKHVTESEYWQHHWYHHGCTFRATEGNSCIFCKNVLMFHVPWDTMFCTGCSKTSTTIKIIPTI